MIPAAISGIIGVYVSLHTLRTETPGHLPQEAMMRAQSDAEARLYNVVK